MRSLDSPAGRKFAIFFGLFGINLFVSVIFLISAKADNSNHTLFLNFKCKPEGATLITGPQSYTCPVTLKYSIDDADIRNGYIKIFPVTVTWASGARKRTNPIISYLKNGLNQEFIILRPSHPGLNIDEEVEAKNYRSDQNDNSDDGQVACHLRFQILALGCSTMSGPMSGINSMNCLSEVYKQEARECN